MKIVRLGMTEGGLLLLIFVSKYCAPDAITNQMISRSIMSLMNWLYTTSGYYDKTVKGSHFNFDATALNKRFFEFIRHLELAVANCDTTQFIFHHGFIMGLYERYKQQFIDHFKIRNFVLLNETHFSARIPSIFSCMEGKKVLVISSFSGLIQKQWDSGNVVKAYEGSFPNIRGLSGVVAPYCFQNNGPHANYFETLDSLFEEIKKHDFDIALLGCGSYGHMLTHKIHSELGKDAIYVGGTITNLFGILSTRERIHSKIKTNEFWVTEIPDEYKPANYKSIEDGCYW
jgi:hypothetical protein